VEGHSRFYLESNRKALYDTEMKLTYLLFCFAAISQAQTPSDSQLLLNEVRLLRQDLAASNLAVQRVQILLYRLNLEESAMNRASQRLDQAKSSLTGIQQRRKNQADEVAGMEAELQRTQDAAQKERLPRMIAGVKKEIENWASSEQEAQSRVIDAETQIRAEQAKRDQLEAALDKLDKQIEGAIRQ
jgi:chromosome segregation ATPase